MAFLLVVPMVWIVAAAHRHLALYAPSNVLVRNARLSARPWQTSAALIALTAACLGAVHLVSEAVSRGASAWLHLAVLILAWDAIKFATLALGLAGRGVTRLVHPAGGPRGSVSSNRLRF